MSLRDKFISYRIEDGKFVRVINLFGYEIKRYYKKYLLNEKLCSKVGIKTLLFIRDDGIGDFIMNMPYIKYLKQSKKYHDYKIILAATQNITDMAKKYLSEYIDSYILISKKNNVRLAEKCKKMSFTTLINPVDAKVNYAAEIIAENVTAKEKICHFGYFSAEDSLSPKNNVPKVISKYTRIIETGKELMLVKDRCKKFFELLLDEKIPPVETLKELEPVDLDMKSDYIIVSPFTRDKRRTYSADNFIKIIDFITDELKVPVVLIGTKKERTDAVSIKEACKNQDKIFNMTGLCSLSESILYIKNAKMMVANETGTVHIAQNYGIRTICISNGSYYGAFWPYPEEESHVTYVYPENLEEYLTANNLHGILSDYDIDKIDYKRVISTISEVWEEINTQQNKELCHSGSV